jgi:hypothetical protein
MTGKRPCVTQGCSILRKCCDYAQAENKGRQGSNVCDSANVMNADNRHQSEYDRKPVSDLSSIRFPETIFSTDCRTISPEELLKSVLAEASGSHLIREPKHQPFQPAATGGISRLHGYSRERPETSRCSSSISLSNLSPERFHPPGILEL